MAAADFFAAMKEPDLLPAAGPGSANANGARFHEFETGDLTAGLDHLDGLDAYLADSGEVLLFQTFNDGAALSDMDDADQLMAMGASPAEIDMMEGLSLDYTAEPVALFKTLQEPEEDAMPKASEDGLLYGSSETDLLIYNPTDYLVDGMDGIDVMLSDHAPEHTLSQMLISAETHNADAGMPMVSNVDVLLSGVDTASLTSMADLAEKYGIEIHNSENGGTLILKDGWEKDEKRSEESEKTDFYTKTVDNAELTLETTMTEPDSGMEAAAMQAANEIVLSSNG